MSFFPAEQRAIVEHVKTTISRYSSSRCKNCVNKYHRPNQSSLYTLQILPKTAQDRRTMALDMANSELFRLHTYGQLRVDLSGNWPATMAREGFYYHREIDKLACFSCNLGLDYRQEQFDAVELHRKHAPRCRQLNGGDPRNAPMMLLSVNDYGGSLEADDAETSSSRLGGIGIVYFGAYTRAVGRGVFPEHSGTVGPAITVERSSMDPPQNDLEAIRRQDEENDNDMLRVHDHGFDVATNERFRESDVDENNVNTSEASSNQADERNYSRSRAEVHDDLAASSSGTNLSESVSQGVSRTARLHRSVSCVEGSVPASGSHLSSSSSQDCASGSSYAVRHPHVSYKEDRVDTFKRHMQKAPTNQRHQLARAGFFHTGNTIRCFCCDGELPEECWSRGVLREGVDPRVKHEQMFPQCYYIKSMKERELQKQLQRQQDLDSVLYETAKEENESLRKENESLRTRYTCLVEGCDNQRDSIFLNCGHFIYCRSCSQEIWENNKPCPACKDKIVNTRDIFM